MRSSRAAISARPATARLLAARARAGNAAQDDLDRVVEDLLEAAPAQAPTRRGGLRLDQAVGERPEHVRDLPRVAGREVSRGDAALDDPGDEGDAGLPEPRHLLEHRAGDLADHRGVLDRPEDLEVVAVVDVVVEVEARGAAQLRRRVEAGRERRAQLLLEDRAALGEHGDVELTLVLEVAVEGPLRDARALGDGVEIRRHEALAEEHLARRVEDAAARDRLLLLATAGARRLRPRRRRSPRSGRARRAWSGCSARRSSG